MSWGGDGIRIRIGSNKKRKKGTQNPLNPLLVKNTPVNVV